jgi:membrane associated rhomboid family serine protease
VTLILIGINLAFFLAEEAYEIFFSSSLIPYLALSHEGLMGGAWWQLISYAFLHGGLLHLLVNMVGLWFVGPLLEELLGGLCYLGLYFGGVLAGGLLQALMTPGSELVGASGAICALLVGFATLLPRLEITALLFFVIPVRMKASTLGWLVILGSFVFWLLGTEQAIAHLNHLQGQLGREVTAFLKVEREIGHLAHLGGGIAGFVICRLYQACGLVRWEGKLLFADLRG